MKRSSLPVALMVIWALLQGSPPAKAADTVTLTPDADAWVADDAPNANHGSDAALRVNGPQPIRRAYLRFNGTIPSGAIVTRTTLRLYAPSTSSDGVSIRATFPSANNWDERTITFNNAPTTPYLFAATRVTTAGWNDNSVPPLNPGSPATYVITPRSTGGSLSFESRESLHKPELVVEYTVPTATATSACSIAGCVESQPWIYTASWATTVADFNGDGLEDHLVGRHDEPSQIQLQQRDGSFTPGFLFPDRDRHSCAAGDINNDGRADLYCSLGADGGEGTKQDEVWIARPDGTYVNEVASWGPVDPYARGRRPLLFDFNNDGLLDLYTTSVGFRPDGQRSENVLWVNRGDPSKGGAGFVERRVGATGPWGELCVTDGDWNNDGYRDLLVCGPQSSKDKNLHLFQNHSGTDMVLSNGLLGAALYFPRDATLSDLNGDGWDDLVIVTARELQIRLNQACAACGRFSQIDYRLPLDDGVSVAAGDLTGDGYEDIYVVQQLANDQNARDILLTGPDWDSLDMPQVGVGAGDTAEFIDVHGQEQVIVTNGALFFRPVEADSNGYSRGPVQFISFRPTVGYPRPKGTAPLRLSLVPVFKQCTAPNSSHPAPLAFPSCRPPEFASTFVTIGDPGANGKAANFVGSATFAVIAGNPSTTADEADNKITASLTDIRNKRDLADYAGELRANMVLRITDKLSDSSVTDGATVQDLPFWFEVPCSTTSVSTIGSTCSVKTTADTLVPGMIREGKRTVTHVGNFRVHDGGADGVADTAGDNTVFAWEGIFTP